MAYEVLEGIGITPEDVIKAKGFDPRHLRPGDLGDRATRLSRKTDNTYYWKIRNKETSGSLLALSIICREMLANPDLATQQYNDLLRRVVLEGLSVLQEREARSKGKVRHSSQGLTYEIGEKVGLSNVVVKHILRALRVNGVIEADNNVQARNELREVIDDYVVDNQKMFPSQRRVDVNYHGDYRNWYAHLIKQGGHAIGSFVPYELTYWSFLLDQYQDKPLPFSLRVIDYYANAREQNLTNKETGLISQIRNDSQIPIDRKTFEITLGLLVPDLPIPKT